MNSLAYIKQVFLNLTVRDFKLKYKGSMLGVFWAFINPLILSLALCFVFKTIIKVQITDYSFFVISVIFNWYCFSLCFSQSPYAIVSQANILKQFSVPSYVFVFSFVSANYLNFLLGWIWVFLFFIYKGKTAFSFLPLAFLFIFMQFIFTVGISALFAFANVLKKDTSKFTEIITMLWFWFTPVFYSMDMIPQKYRGLVYLNPMYHYITAMRDIMFRGQIPSAGVFIGAGVFALVFIGLMFFVFKLIKNKLVKRI